MTPRAVRRTSTVRDMARRALAALSFAPLLGWEPLLAQGVRVTGTTTAQYIEVRPFVTDSVPVDSTLGTGQLRESTRGVAVRCVPDETFCRYIRAADDAVAAVPLIQDVELSAWGFGTGIQLYAHLRGRSAMGEARDLWPRAEDSFDALALYLEVDRERVRGRIGRQWKTSGLGFYNFDGASLLIRAPWGISADLFGGWSLVRGLHEPVTSDAIAAVEEFPPDERAYLFGAELRARPRRRAAVGLLYQRELRTDRDELYSERIAADGALRLGRLGMLDGELEADLATGELNEARLRTQLPLRDRLSLTVEARRYRPFFELWTIWGAFSPVGFGEANAAARWGRANDRLTIQLRGGWRRYDDSDAGVGFLPLKRDGWRFGADAAWRVTDRWTSHAGYRTDIGFGAARTDGDVGLRWEPPGPVYAGVRATAFQTLYEFRLGEGRTLGVGVDGGLRIRPEVRLVADAALYRHRFEDFAPARAWTQRRASMRLEWTVGRDPGMDRSAEGAP